MGIIDQLKVAETPAVITELLAQAASYTMAAEATMRRWKRVAKARLQELELAKTAK